MTCVWSGEIESCLCSNIGSSAQAQAQTTAHVLQVKIFSKTGSVVNLIQKCCQKHKRFCSLSVDFWELQSEYSRAYYQLCCNYCEKIKSGINFLKNRFKLEVFEFSYNSNICIQHRHKFNKKRQIETF